MESRKMVLLNLFAGRNGDVHEENGHVEVLHHVVDLFLVKESP